MKTHWRSRIVTLCGWPWNSCGPAFLPHPRQSPLGNGCGIWAKWEHGTHLLLSIWIPDLPVCLAQSSGIWGAGRSCRVQIGASWIWGSALGFWGLVWDSAGTQSSGFHFIGFSLKEHEAEQPFFWAAFSCLFQTQIIFPPICIYLIRKQLLNNYK